ncbi:MAG: sigma-70 family RNA polymerase sigma factor [Propionicimonas sp.]
MSTLPRPGRRASARPAAEVFGDYYRQNWLPVLRFIRRRVADPELARDLGQETFAVAWKEFDPAAPQPLVWLYRVAWHRVQSSRRHRDRDGNLVALLAHQHRAEGVDHAVDLVAAVLDQLDDGHREVLELKYWDDLTAAEIGLVLGLSEAAVWQRLSRARAAMRALLADQAVRGGQ